jgi:hypothetical protein
MNRSDLPQANLPLEATTANPGTGWTTFTAEPLIGWCRLHNGTGTAIEYSVKRGDTWGAVNVNVPDGSVRNVFGVNDMSRLRVRRVDQSNTQVVVKAEALS